MGRRKDVGSVVTEKSSFGQILKSTSVMGGVAVVSLLLGMIRTKFAAVLLGISGAGLLASFTAIQGVVGSIAGLGLHASAVRNLAVAVGKSDAKAIGLLAIVLRRLSWLTGFAGMALVMVFSSVLSNLTFESEAYALDIAGLGIVILFSNRSNGYLALLQGMRCIGDIARANIISGVAITISTVSFYVCIGLRGIVPALILSAGIQLIVSWYFANRIPLTKVEATWRESFAEAGDMLTLGIVMMWNGLSGSLVTYATVVMIANQFDLWAVGIYNAAFALSGMFVNFVLQSMGTDYYPRLASVSGDSGAVNRVVNEQTEVSLLLALPGLLGTLVLAPWIVQIFYSEEFLPAIDLLNWFVLGCLGRVISWPLSYMLLAVGRSRWFIINESIFKLIQVLLVYVGLRFFGIEGAAIAFFLTYIGYIGALYLIAGFVTCFKWNRGAVQIGALSTCAMVVAEMVMHIFADRVTAIIGAPLVLFAGVYSLRELIARVGADHRLAKIVFCIPLINRCCFYKK